MRTTVLGLSAILLAGCAGNMDEMHDSMDMADKDKAMESEGGMMHGEAHAHMMHVGDAWEDTPDGMGFLPTARAEAEIAAQHAALAAEQPDNLEWMQMHAGHVIHALDPAMEAEGPGLGYGVKQAAENTAKHITIASESGDASDNVKLHAPHIATSAGNVVTWSDMIIERAAAVRSAESAGEAAPLVMEMQEMTQALLDGIDANGDGEATWEEGEGGIAQAEKHLQFMRDGEGMS